MSAFHSSYWNNRLLCVLQVHKMLQKVWKKKERKRVESLDIYFPIAWYKKQGWDFVSKLLILNPGKRCR